MLNFALVKDARRIAASRPRPASHYSYLGSDIPSRLPLLSPLPAIRISVEESIRYTVDHPESADEWLWTATVGDSQVRLGPNRRFFSLVQAHEQHCMRWMRTGLAAEDVLTAQRAHMTHCLNFMRQLVLCHADTTLEFPYVLTRNRTIERWDADHRCVDWHAIYETMRLNYLDWDLYGW